MHVCTIVGPFVKVYVIKFANIDEHLHAAAKIFVTYAYCLSLNIVHAVMQVT